MTDPSPDTQQIEMLKTLLHDSRTERTRLADEVDRLRALADPAPVGLTEDERELVDRVLANDEDPEYEKSAIIDLFAAEALHKVFDGPTVQQIRHARYVTARRASDMVSDRFRLAQALDRLSAAPVDDRERVPEAPGYDRGMTARRILNWAGKHDADGKLVGVAVGTDARNVTVDAATMVRLLNNADAARRERVPEGWRVEWLAESPIGPVNVPRLVPYRPEDTKGGDDVQPV